VKDFAWERGEKGFVSKWGPLGGGMVRPRVFHLVEEVDLPGADFPARRIHRGDTPENLAQMKRDYAVLLDWLRTA
jgi:hypothetical protein